MPVAQCNGADLYYEEQGAGPPIVFLHGAFAGLRFFEPQLVGLSEEFHTVALDFRGHGRSEKTETGHTLPQHARDLQVFLEQLNLTDVAVVGWSMGALVSWEYVNQFGTERIRALVDVDMEPSPFQREDYEFGTYMVEGLRDALDGIQSNPLELTDDSIEALLKDPPSRERRNMMFDEQTRTPPSVQGSMLLDAMRDYRDVLPEIDVPTLVCAGADEKWRGVANVRYAAELIPDVQFELFEQSGHCLTIEEPERFNRVLAKFLDSD
ncbi:alpha/beta fold hydrolase [Halobacterium zhouii]|uniref:alpha/beta fold hydrolase n=1 Tax=Halobacterium zhouii TaxID=2902624 RepID=UPI001E5864C5|nr:alpha/beta hydrolase [Halobacterium zhouii]